ncbi:MAG: phosphatidylserine synthase [Proteobacteria bacterium]|nr:phosphatidylserine synthase [Pseudomonadota bacterium]
MSLTIAIPVFRIGCKVGIDRGRAWSVVDETVLWAVTRQSRSIASLAKDADLPRQIVTASIARLMRFRLVEVVVMEAGVAFRASPYGFDIISSGAALPFFPKRISRPVSFVVEWATGDFFPTRQIRLLSPNKLEQARRAGSEVRVIAVEGGGPSMSPDANLNRLSEIAARGWNEQVAVIDSRTATMHDNEYMALRVVDGMVQGLPDTAGPALRRMVSEAAALPAGAERVPVTYAGVQETLDHEPAAHSCKFDPSDIVIGGSAQRACLESLIASAQSRVIIHSTFLDAKRFDVLLDLIRSACRRGVRFDLLWGAEKDEETEIRNAAEAAKIAALIRSDRDLAGRVIIHMRTTGSHAKLILVDTPDAGWIAGVGSCNWVSSPFQSVELTVVLRDQHAVADVMVAFQQMVGRRGLADGIANELGITARDLRRMPTGAGTASVTVVVGDGHERLARAASGQARARLVIGSNRLGSTARPGAIMPGEVAAERAGVRAVVLYTQTTGPIKNRHGRALTEEAYANGVVLARTPKKLPLHGKFVAWDQDDVIVTSLNWASASSDPDFPWGDIGVHVHGTGIASSVLARLEILFPEIAADAGGPGYRSE